MIDKIVVKIILNIDDFPNRDISISLAEVWSPGPFVSGDTTVCHVWTRGHFNKSEKNTHNEELLVQMLHLGQ